MAVLTGGWGRETEDRSRADGCCRAWHPNPCRMLLLLVLLPASLALVPGFGFRMMNE